jgi:hypothetical protein
MTKTKNLLPAFFLSLTGCLLFLLPLFHAWMIYPLGIESPYTSYSAIGGLLPQSDAAAYYLGAQNFLDNGELDAWNTRRPLNALLFALRLWLSNNNFQLALVFQALLCGLSCILVTRCINRSFGKIAGITTFLILFLFATNFLPTTLSEILGLTLGALGFVLLWQSIITNHLIASSNETKYKLKLNLTLGTFLLTIALNARAGAFFVLPLLILWIGISTYKTKNSKNKHILFGSIFPIFLGIISGFIFNFLLIGFYSNSEGLAHSNFAFTLFGLVAGGKGWTYAYTLYPELLAQPETMVAKFLYNESLTLFFQKPWLLFLGFSKGIVGLLKSLISFFQFKLPSAWALKAFIRLLGVALVGISLYRLKKLYDKYPKEIGFVGTGLLGMLLSAGIIWTDGGFRVFAATIPFFAAGIGIVVGSFFSEQKALSIKPITTAIPVETRVACYLGIFLAATAFLGPALIQKNNFFSSNTPAIIPNNISNFNFICNPNETAIITKTISTTPHIYLNPTSNRFKKSILRGFQEENKPFLNIIKSNILNKPIALGLVFDLKTQKLKYILSPPEIFSNYPSNPKPHSNRLIGLCGTPIPGAETITQINSFEVQP